MGSLRQLGTAPHLLVLQGGNDRHERPLSDEELVRALRDGDSAKAGLLYDRLIRVVDAALVRILGRREQDHDDLIQTVFEQILMALMKGRFAGACALSGWASAVACHTALNALRSRVRERKVLDRNAEAGLEALVADRAADPEHQIGVRAELAQVCDELARMNPDRATTVLLHDAFGHELAEIAVLTGVSVAAAQSRLVRGRKELHQRMADRNDAGERP